jgi:hypothetical protein
MLRRVALLRADVSRKRHAFITRVTIVGELRTALATRRNIPEDNILYSHRRENLKIYIDIQLFLTFP